MEKPTSLPDPEGDIDFLSDPSRKLTVITLLGRPSKCKSLLEKYSEVRGSCSSWRNWQRTWTPIPAKLSKCCSDRLLTSQPPLESASKMCLKIWTNFPEPPGSGCLVIFYTHIGVCFRMYAESEAKKIGVVGWVKNTRKGTVIGQVQGPEEKVNSMKSWLSRVGSPSSRIDRTNFSNEKAISKVEYANFSIRY
ncbi:acylphosphatase-2 isoform 1-T1 [Trichechus inunguis]